MEVFRVSYAVEARYAGYDYYVPSSAQKLARTAQAQFFDLVIDAQILLDVGICDGRIRLRLVVVVIGDKVLYGIFREERLEFSIQLRCQSLVVT